MAAASHRLFIALELPDAVIHEIVRAQRFLKRKDLFDGKYPQPDVIHLTIKFIGEVSEADCAVIKAALATIHAKKLKLQLDALNYFGSPQYMNVIFIKVAGDHVVDLVHVIDQTLSDFVSPESPEFVAHITLARVKSVYDSTALLEAMELFPLEPISFEVDSFVLMESELTMTGPLHRVVERYSLTVR